MQFIVGGFHAHSVSAALQNQNVRTSTPISPISPKNVVAIAWNVLYQRLYVIDVEADINGKNRLRLLTVRPDGIATEVWRTKPTKKLPDRVTLTVSGTGAELVLGLIGRPGPHSSEILLLDGFGKPALSRDFDERLARPALVIPRGVNLPFERGKHDVLPLRNEMRPRSDFSVGICGAHWLRSHGDRVIPSNVLAPSGCEDKDDESNED